jgi:hypothetical protein
MLPQQQICNIPGTAEITTIFPSAGMNLRFAHASELPGRRLLQTHWLRDALIQEARVSSFNISWTRLTPSIPQEVLSWPPSLLGSPDKVRISAKHMHYTAHWMFSPLLHSLYGPAADFEVRRSIGNPSVRLLASEIRLYHPAARDQSRMSATPCL